MASPFGYLLRRDSGGAAQRDAGVAQVVVPLESGPTLVGPSDAVAADCATDVAVDVAADLRSHGHDGSRTECGNFSFLSASLAVRSGFAAFSVRGGSPI